MSRISAASILKKRRDIEWVSDDLDPEQLTWASHKRAKFQCKQGHTWEISISKVLYGGHGCAKCKNQHGPWTLERMLENTVPATNKLNGLEDCKVWNYTSHTVGHKGKTYLPYQLSVFLSRGKRVKPGEVIRHLCGNGSCIVPDHLKIGTHVENASDRRLHGTMLTGEQNPTSKLSDAQQEAIRLSNDTTTNLMKKFASNCADILKT